MKETKLPAETTKPTTKPALINFAFEAEKKRLEESLESSKGMIVTIENLKSDKALAASLTAKGKAYKASAKDVIDELLKPINVYKGQVKELQDLCDASASEIKDQIAVFEKAKLDEISTLLSDLLLVLRDNSSIDEGYRIHNIPKAKLGFITAKSALTKGAKDALISIVSIESATKSLTELRLAELKADSLDAGLDAPLVRANVEHVLFASNSDYAAAVATLIDAELVRQKEGVARKARLSSKDPEPLSHEESARAKALLSVPIKATVETAETGNKPHFKEAQISENPTLRSGNIAVKAIATFDLSVPEHVTNEMIVKKLNGMMSKAGITSLSSVEIER